MLNASNFWSRYPLLLPKLTEVPLLLSDVPLSTFVSVGRALRGHVIPGFDFAQQMPTTRRSVEGICRESIFAQACNLGHPSGGDVNDPRGRMVFSAG
jgi:hypothetical protein